MQLVASLVQAKTRSSLRRACEVLSKHDLDVPAGGFRVRLHGHRCGNSARCSCGSAVARRGMMTRQP